MTVEIPEGKSPLEFLVEQKGNDKFKDPDFLATSKLESDNHIESLNAEIATLKEKLTTQASLDEAMQALDAKAKEMADRMNSYFTEKPAAEQGESVDVESIVDRKLRQMQDANVRVSNRSKVQSELTTRYGDTAGEVLKETASKLGVSEQDMLDLAETKPGVFLAALPPAGQTETNNLPASDVSKITSESGDIRNKAYYDKMRKEMGNRYFAPSFQKQMMLDRKALGDKWET